MRYVMKVIRYLAGEKRTPCSQRLKLNGWRNKAKGIEIDFAVRTNTGKHRPPYQVIDI